MVGSFVHSATSVTGLDLHWHFRIALVWAGHGEGMARPLAPQWNSHSVFRRTSVQWFWSCLLCSPSTAVLLQLGSSHRSGIHSAHSTAVVAAVGGALQAQPLHIMMCGRFTIGSTFVAFAVEFNDHV